jgi:putative transposase
MQEIKQLAQVQSLVAACQVLGVPRSTWYRSQPPKAEKASAAVAAEPMPGVQTAPDVQAQPQLSRPAPPRALSETERTQVLEVLHSERFQDQSPREVYATLLDEQQYLCSPRTMYRILSDQDEVRERRDQLRHPAYAKPQLVATGANQAWSWDITKLLSAVKWTYYYLYVLLDIFSRYVVGWMIAEQESADLAQQLIAESYARHGIRPGQLQIHSDRGGPMTAKTIDQLLVDLGVTKSHSRPHVPNDNPFSEAQFKTMKYHPTYPERFGSLEDARAWARTFFPDYNDHHHHTGLGLLTPADVHFGRAPALLAQRQTVLAQAYAAHPERFVKGVPVPLQPPLRVWINQPATDGQASELPALSSPSLEEG